MFKAVTFLFVLLSVQSFSQVGWTSSFENAQKLAVATDRLILVDFWATWCGPCKKMDRESWSDREVQEITKAYVPLKIDLDKRTPLAQKFGVNAIPLVLIMDGHGEMIFQQVGYMNKEELSEILKEYALNTSFLRTENLNYFKHQNYASGIRLAQKYIDYSQYLQKDIRFEFLALANNYLRNGEKMLDKDQSNYINMKEKVSLMEIQIDLYLNKMKRVSKKLEKNFEPSNMSRGNKLLYTYLNYCVSLSKKDNLEITKWKSQLASIDNSNIYLKKSELFMN
ncbi:thioredoxin family protein [Gillisia marina]|uniref:thioredoxin family protein n=1 Tax=Gillisia marina TaxID=1167637 RepID=UPI00029B47B5|nr:thioredoxin family protein [Gillisia marina]